MKILDIVRFNQGVACVVDEMPEKVHEKIDSTLMYGMDETGTLYRCYEYDSPSGRFKAFGGAKFDLKMRGAWNTVMANGGTRGLLRSRNT